MYTVEDNPHPTLIHLRVVRQVSLTVKIPPTPALIHGREVSWTTVVTLQPSTQHASREIKLIGSSLFGGIPVVFKFKRFDTLGIRTRKYSLG